MILIHPFGQSKFHIGRSNFLASTSTEKWNDFDWSILVPHPINGQKISSQSNYTMEDLILARTNSMPLAQHQIRNNVPSTVILLDWDDTLFPNSYLAKKSYSIDDMEESLSLEDETLMEHLSNEIITFLKTCIDTNRTVMIVTNGELGWVERSCKRFLPSLFTLILSLRIVSARTTYQAICPIQEWKVACFTAELTRHFIDDSSGETRHVISIGDSHFERQALQVIPSRMPKIKTKSVKFIEKPSVIDMIRQLKLMSIYLSHLCSHPDHLDLILSHAVLNEISI